MAEFVTVEQLAAGGPDAGDRRQIAVLRFARPPMNFLSQSVLREIAEAARQLAEDVRVAAVIVYGDERIFSAGDDWAELAGLSAEEASAMAADRQQALSCLTRLPQPTVAAISGYALGAGLELALGADYRVVGDNVKLGFPQIQAGLIPLSGMNRLVAEIGLSAAHDLIRTGRFIPAEAAATLGLVDAVVAPDAVYSAAWQWAHQFATGPTQALSAAKALFTAGGRVPTSADSDSPADVVRNQWVRLFASEDRVIGTRACLIDGPGSAVFTGR